MTMMVMFTNIEGTVVRYDTNGNNKLDISEVRKAYDVAFYSAVEGLVEMRASIIAKLPFNLGKNISKRIYYYLIKYNDVPKTTAQYLKLLFIKASPAHRQTIAAVLKIIGDEASSGEGMPVFDCETLR
jgi:hypothetical protein